MMGMQFTKPVVDEVGDFALVLLGLEAVADDVLLLVDLALGVQRADDADVEPRRGFEVDVVFQGFFEHEAEVRRLGAVGVGVRALVVGLGNGVGKPALGPLNLGADFGQVGEAQRRAVFLHKGHQINVVEAELVVLNGKVGRRKVERLRYQVVVSIHSVFECGRKSRYLRWAGQKYRRGGEMVSATGGARTVSPCIVTMELSDLATEEHPSPARQRSKGFIW
jgi:hypothetical protein